MTVLFVCFRVPSRSYTAQYNNIIHIVIQNVYPGLRIQRTLIITPETETNGIGAYRTRGAGFLDGV